MGTPGGAEVSQVSTITAALGKELGMWPKDFAGEMKANQLCCDAADLLSDVFAKKDAERLGKWMAHFEGQFEKSGGPFLFGSKLTSADYTIFSTFLMAGEAGASELAKCSKLTAYMAEMKKQKGYL